MTYDYPTPDVALRAEALVGEGPCWDPRTGLFCWVDIEKGELIESDLTTGASKITELGTMLGAAVPRSHADGFAVAVADGLGFVVDGTLDIVEPVLPEPERRMNDAKCDSRGRLWAGSTHLDFTPGGGALHKWDGAEPSEVSVSGLTLPNGIGWNPEDTVMYLVDSMTHTLHTASFDSDDGVLGTLRQLCTIDEGLPDGLAVDTDGCIWVAVWGGWAVHRFSTNGKLIERVPMPVAQPSSCAFDDDGTLYITSARSGLSEEELVDQPAAGSVFALTTSTLGVPINSFSR